MSVRIAPALVGEHGMTGVSYSTLRDYVINRCRQFADATPPVTATRGQWLAVEDHLLLDRPRRRASPTMPR